jgi:hypothetical protein
MHEMEEKLKLDQEIREKEREEQRAILEEEKARMD